MMMSRLVRNCPVGNARWARAMSFTNPTDEFPLKFNTAASSPKKADVSNITLENGIKVALSNQHGAIASVKIGVRGGSSAESLSEKGSAQLLTCYSYSNKTQSALLSAWELEGLGSRVSVSADREKIVYNLLVPNENLYSALDILVSNIKAPIHKHHSVESAKKRAQISYDLHHACGSSQLSEYLHEASYGENTPLGGSFFANSLNDLDATDVIHYHNGIFAAENILVAVQGDIHGDKFKSFVTDKFGSGFATGTMSPAPPSRFTGGEVRVRHVNGGKTRAGLSFAVPSGEAGKASRVLQQILQSRVAARDGHSQIHLHSRVHHVNKKSSWTKTFFHPYTAGGIFGVTLKGDAEYVTNGLQQVAAQLKSVASGSVTADELAGAKNRVGW